MPATEPRLRTLAAVAAGVRFLPRAWRAVWPALALACLVGGLWISAPRDGVLAGLAILAVWIAQGALWRLAFDWIVHRRGLHIGKVEWRTLAVWLLAGAFLVIVKLLGLLLLVAAAYGVASAGRGFSAVRPDTWAAAARGQGSLLLGVLGFGAVLAVVFIAARLSLAGAATAACGRIQVLATWARTRGQAARLAVVFALLGAGPLALALLAWTRPWDEAGRASPFLAGLCGAAALGVWLPLHAGAAAHVWRVLAPATNRTASGR